MQLTEKHLPGYFRSSLHGCTTWQSMSAKLHNIIFHNTVTWIHSMLWQPQISFSHNLTFEIKLWCCITYLKVPVFLFPVHDTRRTRGLRTVVRGIRLWDAFYAKLCFTKQWNTPHQISLPTLSSFIHSFSILSDDRSKASSKTMPPYSAMQSLLLQMRISSPVLKVIQ